MPEAHRWMHPPPQPRMLTVSSQIKNPISVGGRILDVFMEI
jgi:hypothetical protein